MASQYPFSRCRCLSVLALSRVEAAPPKVKTKLSWGHDTKLYKSSVFPMFQICVQLICLFYISKIHTFQTYLFLSSLRVINLYNSSNYNMFPRNKLVQLIELSQKKHTLVQSLEQQKNRCGTSPWRQISSVFGIAGDRPASICVNKQQYLLKWRHNITLLVPLSPCVGSLKGRSGSN